MASRSGYAALTPEVTTFPPNPATFIPAPPSPSSSTPALSSAPNFLDNARARWQAIVEPFRAFVQANAGLLLVAASQFFLALVNVCVKTLNSLEDPVPTMELIIVRMSITYICSMLFMWWRKVPDPFLGPKGVRLLLVFRGFIGFFGLFGVYYSLQYLSLSDATVLTFLSPIFTGIAGALILGEQFSKRQMLAGLCSFVGVVLIARPAFLFGSAAHIPAVTDEDTALGPPSEKGTPAQRLIAVGVALIGVVGATGAYTSIRAIGKRAHPLHSLAFFSSQSVVVASIGMIIMRVPVVVPMHLAWMVMLSLIGIFGFIAQVLLTMGLQRETAGRASLAIYVGIIYALALEKIFFHVTPSALSIAGTAIIMSSAIYIAVRSPAPFA
ncbi:EamA-like transporter family-domain-containing protein [Amylostereum chailletii]|nr:EamA-like transporter family-domain-containing protein [Amylostereum chailletii]